MAAETVEELAEPRGSSLLSIAMALAFVGGASVAAWYVFAEDLQAWSRQEALVWDAPATVSMVQERRHTLTVGNKPPETVTERYTWSLAASAVRMPEAPAQWRQTLTHAEIEIREGEVVRFAHTWTEPNTQETIHDRAGDPALDWTYRVGDLIGVAILVAEDADRAIVTDLPEADLELLATRETGKEPPRWEPLDAVALKALGASLQRFVEPVASALLPPLSIDAHRPGQIWVDDRPFYTEHWGDHVVRHDLRMAGYDGDLALVTAAMTRPPSAVELGQHAHGLSSLLGSADFRFDLVAGRPDSGRIHLDLRGKIDGKFGTLSLDQVWALGEAPSIPIDFALPALPPPVAPPTE